jgi:hypothetical protein
MKPEEAYRWLYVHFAPCGDETKQDEAVNVALKALEKQIPKKPTIKQDKYNENLYTLYCPTCGSYIGMYNKRLKMSDFFNDSNRNICNRCGRAIDCEVEA